MEQAEEIFERFRPLFGRVPTREIPFLCPICRGPKKHSYEHCNSCEELIGQGLPPSLHAVVAPVSTARKPSTWYSYLLGYKTYDSVAPLALRALLHFFVSNHSARIAEMCGGSPDIWTFVPSKRNVVSGTQPLHQNLARIQLFRPNLRHCLEYVPGQLHGRSLYNPDLFRPRQEGLKGRRMVLIEDTWVTGGTAMSAAGALLRAGAGSLVVLCAARAFNESHCPPDHPYHQEHLLPYDVTAWPLAP